MNSGVNVFRAKNREGIEVEYSLELARDLLAVYGLVASDIINNMYGTSFNVQKSVGKDGVREYAILTNDGRDGVLARWKE